MEGKTESAPARDERLLAHLAHELRAPLNAIIGYSDAMREGVFGPLDERYGEYADIIHGAGRHMLALAEDLLERARMSDGPRAPGPTETFDAGEAAAWALRLLALEAQAAEVNLSLEGGPTRVTGDRRALAQIIVNLAANAVRQAPAGSTVTVALEVRGADLRLTVSDEGPGFTPGWETRGIGLALVRELAGGMGGELEVANRPERGAVVSIMLPIVEAGA